jgi:hypothetical protein
VSVHGHREMNTQLLSTFKKPTAHKVFVKLPALLSLQILMLSAVGKTSITTQFVENQFSESYDPTIENSK